jgi:DNA-binding CsgD family transcriptional regulator
MESNLKRTGIFWGIIFSFGTAISVITGIFGENKLSFAQIISNSTFISVAAVTVLFFVSAYIRRLAFIQPLIFLVITPIGLIGSHLSFYGLSFFVIAIVLLFRLGFFERRRVLKLVLCLVWLFGWEVFAAIQSGTELVYAFSPIFVIAVFLVFMYFAFQERLVVYLKEPKPSLSLADKGLSPAEKIYIKEITTNRSAKEICVDYEVSESTVRNSLARAFKKIGVPGQSEFMSLAATHEIVD